MQIGGNINNAGTPQKPVNPLIKRYRTLTDRVNDLYSRVDNLEDREIKLEMEELKLLGNMKKAVKTEETLFTIKKASPYVAMASVVGMVSLSSACPPLAVAAGVTLLTTFFGERYATSKRPKLIAQFGRDKAKLDSTKEQKKPLTKKREKLQAEYDQARKEWISTRNAIENSEEEVRKIAEAIKPPKLERKSKISDEGSHINFGGVKLKKFKK